MNQESLEATKKMAEKLNKINEVDFTNNGKGGYNFANILKEVGFNGFNLNDATVKKYLKWAIDNAKLTDKSGKILTFEDFEKDYKQTDKTSVTAMQTLFTKFIGTSDATKELIRKTQLRGTGTSSDSTDTEKIDAKAVSIDLTEKTIHVNNNKYGKENSSLALKDLKAKKNNIEEHEFAIIAELFSKWTLDGNSSWTEDQVRKILGVTKRVFTASSASDNAKIKFDISAISKLDKNASKDDIKKALPFSTEIKKLQGSDITNLIKKIQENYKLMTGKTEELDNLEDVIKDLIS